ncbi:MAG TPA: hypothetical protein VLE48_03745 [Terriglobales bacterium]|nr:hypothetical protein [Terriglobales bacterium]
MAGGASKALRILGIVFLSVLIVLASLIFLLLAACGLFSSRSSEDMKFVAFAVVTFGAILVGGFYGIFKLAKGMSQAPAATADAPPPPPLPAAEAAKLLQPLRLAIGISIGVSFLGIVITRMQPGYPVKLLPVMIVSFVLYQLPYGAVLWLTREQPERKGVALALAYSAVSVVHSLWVWGTLLLYAGISTRDPSRLAALVDIVATGAAAYFAWQLWRRDRRAVNEAATLVLWFIASAVYLAIAHFAQQAAYRWVL